MNKSAVLWVIQAITECLPISSSGHVALYELLTGKEEGDHVVSLSERAYMLAHVPALCASLVYTQSIWEPLLMALLSGDLLLIISPLLFISITTVLSVIGYLLHKKCRIQFPLWIGFSLSALTALCIGLMKTHHSIYAWSYHDACIVGLVQALVVVPGLSRLGCVTLAGCLLGYSPVAAYALAWVVHIPLMFGGVLLAVVSTARNEIRSIRITTVLASMVLVGYCYLLLYGTDFLLRVGKYWYFACYLCIPIGIAWYKNRENV